MLRSEDATRRSSLPVRALLLYVALLPFHSLLIALLLAHTGLPLPVLKVVAAWKEVLLVATFVGVLATARARKDLPAVLWVNWIALAWLGQVLLYFTFGHLLFGQPSGPLARLYLARDWILYVVPYAIGRLASISERDLIRVLRVLCGIGSRGGWCLSMGDYVTGRGAIAAGGR
jgi:hypothetical protein